MTRKTLALIVKGDAAKGDVLGHGARRRHHAAKRTADLIPLCQSAALSKVTLDIEPDAKQPGCRCAHRQGHRPDRRRDGGADRRSVAWPHHLRLVKAVERGIASRPIHLVENEGRNPALPRQAVRRSTLTPLNADADAYAAELNNSAPLPEESVGLPRLPPHAGARRRLAAHPPPAAMSR